MASSFNLKTKEVKKSTLFDYMAPGMTNLKMGAPGESMLKKCAEAVRKAAVHRMDQPDSHLLFQYGPEAGDRLFLETLAKFLTNEYQSPVDVDDLIASAGATHGLNMLTHLLFSPGDLVFVEDPTYFIATKMLQEDCKMKTVPVVMDEQGIIPEELEKVLQAHHQSHPPPEPTEKKPFWSMLYCMPTFHNPTGICLSPERSKKIVDLARKYNLMVVCDDVYNLLYFPNEDGSTPNLKRLFAYDDKSDSEYRGNVVSNGTFSKIFGPGIRLGWMEVPPVVKEVIVTSGVALSGGGFNHATSGIMTSIISLGILGDLVKNAQELYQTRCSAVCDAIRKHMPTASFHKPQGGYFAWIKLPNGIKAADVLQRCEEEHKITFLQGDLCSLTGSFQDHIRISFSFYDINVLVETAESIAKVVNSISQGK